MLGDNQWCSPCCCCKLLPESGYSAGNDFSDKCWNVVGGSQGASGMTFTTPGPTGFGIIYGSAWRCFIVPQCNSAEVRMRATVNVNQAKESMLLMYALLSSSPIMPAGFSGLGAGWWVRSGARYSDEMTGDLGYHANRMITVSSGNTNTGLPFFENQENPPDLSPWPTAIGQTHEIDARFQYSTVPDKFGAGWSVQHGRISAGMPFGGLGLGELYFGIAAQTTVFTFGQGDTVTFSDFSVTLDYS
jgi:hypothetical protein